MARARTAPPAAAGRGSPGWRGSRASPRAGGQLGPPARRADPEDRPHDHLQRELLQARVQRRRLARRPGGDPLGADLGDEILERGDPGAVEGGKDQLALPHVGALVEQDDRARSDDRGEDRRALARVEHLRRSGEDRLDVLGVAEEDKRPGEGLGDRERGSRSACSSARPRRSAAPTNRVPGSARVRVGPAAASSPAQPGPRPGQPFSISSIR